MFPIGNVVPARYPPVVTWALIAANGAIYLFESTLSPDELAEFVARFALIPARYASGEAQGLADYLPFVSNMFLHGGWLHLIINMWTLWVFGPTVEDRLGPGRYLLFYLGAGVFASVVHAAIYSGSTVPALGASGAIAGVIGCYVRFFPFARLVVVIPILFLPLFFEVPAIAFAGLWFVMQVLLGTVDLLMPSTGGGVAWWAHVGGFVAGVLLATPLRRSEHEYRPYYGDEGVLGFTPQGTR
jgi:membrane associated rhomboid family serine protease